MAASLGIGAVMARAAANMSGYPTRVAADSRLPLTAGQLIAGHPGGMGAIPGQVYNVCASPSFPHAR